jgi:hypothetical protein
MLDVGKVVRFGVVLLIGIWIGQSLDRDNAAPRSLPAMTQATRTARTPTPSPTATSTSVRMTQTATRTPVPTREAVAPRTSGVTLANFNRIREGMSYQEVVSILGSPGELTASSDVAGIKTVMYQWEGESFGANMNAMFQNGKLVTKAQFGLE